MTTAKLTLPEALKTAVAAYEDGRFVEAERLCRSILAAKPDFFDGLQLLASLQTRLNCWNDALTSYDRALAVRPDDAVVFNHRGVILHRLKRSDEALASFEKAIALKPNYADAFL
jgi:tetratricopeptide (TPR) repeat protein